MSEPALSFSAEIHDRISQRNFNRLARFIQGYSGIKMPPTKKTMLEGRLRRRLRATGAASFDSYCDFLFEDGGLEAETIHLIDAVTTNKTDFFREPKHFSYLADVVLPSLAKQGVRNLRAWSSACSTGAEPYTLAMVLDHFAERSSGFRYFVLATDLSTDVLASAQAGVFRREMVAPVPAELYRRYVTTPRDRLRQDVRIHPSLRAKVGFARLNLMDESYPVGEPFDLIFCRNVMIYFDKPTQAAVLQRLCGRLKSGGYLFIGHSETIAGVDLPVVQVANTIFQKT
ncbi:protein-glutamate O-methyltransferase CheR [Phenylobacterium sp.]|uniref:CheR family methyltransferase n=1 Tax=Phenylobacterium sp. TaxID=1871053 RepID=UPI0035ADCA30